MVEGNSTAKPVPYLDESLADPLTAPEKRLVKILEPFEIGKHFPGLCFELCAKAAEGIFKEVVMV